jgi:hypothetical protein
MESTDLRPERSNFMCLNEAWNSLPKTWTHDAERHHQSCGPPQKSRLTIEKKIDPVSTEGSQEGIGLDQLGQRPAFTFTITSVNTLGFTKEMGNKGASWLTFSGLRDWSWGPHVEWMNHRFFRDRVWPSNVRSVHAFLNACLSLSRGGPKPNAPVSVSSKKLVFFRSFFLRPPCVVRFRTVLVRYR